MISTDSPAVTVAVFFVVTYPGALAITSTVPGSIGAATPTPAGPSAAPFTVTVAPSGRPEGASTVTCAIFASSAEPSDFATSRVLA